MLLDIDQVIDSLKVNLPLLWADSSVLLAKSTQLWSKEDKDRRTEKKEINRFLHCVSILCTRNPDNLSNFGIMLALASIADGKLPALVARILNLEVDHKTAHKWMLNNHKTFKKMQAKVACGCNEIVLVFDNFQHFTALRHQRGGASSAAVHGAMLLLLRLHQPKFIVGEQLKCHHSNKIDNTICTVTSTEQEDE